MTTLYRPAAAPTRIPAWAFLHYAWIHSGKKGPRPSTSPRRIPAWFWLWYAWKAAGAKVKPTPIRVKALANLTAKIGVKENPPNSNKCWASLWYGMTGPWCAMSASWSYFTAGSKRFKAGLHYAYVPYIVRDAVNQANGLSVTRSPIPGDLVCYDWERDGTADHVGIFEKWVEVGKSFYAVEGNTAPPGGNQSNGGEVCRQLRTVNLVQAFVRVTE